MERVDPSLSVVMAIATALRTRVGELVDGPKDDPERRAKSALGAEALEVARVYETLPLDVRETVSPVLYAVAARLATRPVQPRARGRRR